MRAALDNDRPLSTVPGTPAAACATGTNGSTVPAIECDDLCLRYFRGRSNALTGVSLKIPQGALCGLLGRNGAGKTSLMSLVAGLRRPSAGSVRVFGEDPWENPRIAPQVAFVYQRSDAHAAINGFKTCDLLDKGAHFRPQWDADLALHLLKRFDLPLKKAVGEMNAEQAAALRCIIGLASRTPLTLFDEVYLGMDAVSRKMFTDELLTDYRAHPRTIIFSTHYISEMERLFSEAIILDVGKVLAHDNTGALCTHGKTLQDTFIGLTLKEDVTYGN